MINFTEQSFPQLTSEIQTINKPMEMTMIMQHPPEID